MAVVFNADEILTMAQEIERSGAAFYRSAARIVRGASSLLLRIAGEEDKHLKLFQEMQRAARGGGNDVEDDPDNAAAIYLRAYADRRVFAAPGDADAVFHGGESMEQVAAIAVGKEKDSIVFYVGMKKMVPFALGRDQLDAIIADEFRHIAWIEKAVHEASPGA